MLTILVGIGCLALLALLAHAAWVIAYALSGQRVIDTRLDDYVRRP